MHTFAHLQHQQVAFLSNCRLPVPVWFSEKCLGFPSFDPYGSKPRARARTNISWIIEGSTMGTRERKLMPVKVIPSRSEPAGSIFGKRPGSVCSFCVFSDAFFCEDPPCLGIGIEWPGCIRSRFLLWCLDRSRFPKPCCQTSGVSLRTTPCSYSTCYRQTYPCITREIPREIPKYASLRKMSWNRSSGYINMDPHTMIQLDVSAEGLLTKASLQHHPRVLRLVVHGHVACPP